jgi:hypothetical protein
MLPQVLFVIVKPDVTKMDENVTTSSLNVLVTVSVCEALVVPTLTLPKLSLVGLADSSCTPSVSASKIASAGFGATRPITRRRAKLKTKNPKMDDFGRAMADPPTNCP